MTITTQKVTITVSASNAFDGKFFVGFNSIHTAYNSYSEALLTAQDLKERAGGPEKARIVDLAKKAGKDG